MQEEEDWVAPEAPTRTLRPEPPSRWGTCCTSARPRPGAICRRSPRRRHSSVPCGATRGTETCRAKAALRCTASARTSRRCAARCSGTRRSSAPCRTRRRCSHSWRSTTSTACFVSDWVLRLKLLAVFFWKMWMGYDGFLC